MKNTSKILLGLAAVSGAAAYIVNRFGPSKKDEPTFEDTLEFIQTDLDNMNFQEFDEFMRSVDEREIPSDLSDSERTEYLKAVSVLSENIQKAIPRFRKSGEITPDEANVLRQVFGAVDSSIDWAKQQMD